MVIYLYCKLFMQGLFFKFLELTFMCLLLLLGLICSCQYSFIWEILGFFINVCDNLEFFSLYNYLSFLNRYFGLQISSHHLIPYHTFDCSQCLLSHSHHTTIMGFLDVARFLKSVHPTWSLGA